MVRRIRVQSVTDMVKERLREMIMEGELAPGAKILQDQRELKSWGSVRHRFSKRHICLE